MNCHPSLKGTGTLQVALCDWNQDKQQPYVSQLMARVLPFLILAPKQTVAKILISFLLEQKGHHMSYDVYAHLKILA